MSILRKLKNKIVDDLIPNELKSPAGAVAAAVALNQFGVPFTKGMGVDGARIGQGSIGRGLSSIFSSIPESIKEGAKSVGKAITKPRFPVKGSENKQSIGDRLLSGIFGPAGLAIGSGLIAGAFTKDKEDPIYTGQDVGLNLQDIAKLANISDPKTASAIGLRFSPDVAARKFTPEEMAATYAANAPQDFTEQRQGVEEGGIIGDQKDFEQFLQDKMNMDKSMLQDKILEDFEKFMKRKRMLENLPEAKDGGIMKAEPKMASAVGDESDDISMQLFGKPVKDLTPDEFKELQDEIDRLMNKFRGAKGGIASMAEGGMMDMGGMEMDLRGGGFVPMGRAEKADDVPARLSKNEFVFTADAVRAAGGGNIDKGADKMYATMKALENKVA